MADLKISQLTGATTPLAGTEVLPIVQGGATKQVSVANLTAGLTQTSNGIVQGSAATGYNFTANTPAAGMTSQLLNWYEEGTWVPVLRFGGASTGITGTFTGTYTRVGNLVMVRGYCSVTNKGSATGAANINGLPFPVKSNTQPFAPGSIYVSGGAIAAGGGEMVQLNFNTSGIDVNKVNPATGADANCTDGNFAASGSFWFSAVYDV